VLGGHRNGSVQLRDVRAPNAGNSLAALEESAEHVQFLPGGWDVVVADRSSIQRFDLRAAKKPLSRLRGHRGHASVASGLFADQHFCAAGGADGVVRLWRWTDGLLAAVPVDEPNPGALIAAVDDDDDDVRVPNDDPTLAAFLAPVPENNDDDATADDHSRHRLRFVSRNSGRVHSLVFAPPTTMLASSSS